MRVGILQLLKVWLEQKVEESCLYSLSHSLSWNIDLLLAVLLLLRLGLESTQQLSGSGLQTTPLISWTSSLQTDIMGPLSLHNCMSQCLIINLSACHPAMLTSWACSSCCLHILPACPDIPVSSHGRAGPEILKSSRKQKGCSFSPLSTEKRPFYIILVPWGPWKQTPLKIGSF